MTGEWEFILTLTDQLRPLRKAADIQDVALRLLGTYLAVNAVNYAHIDGDEFVIGRSYTTGVAPFPPRTPLAFFGHTIAEACRRGETVAVDDVRTDDRFSSADRERLIDAGVIACVRVPLIKDREWLAALDIHSVGPRQWTRNQIALVETTAERTWSAGERARVEEALGDSRNRQTFIRHLNEAIRPLASPARIIAETCRLLGEYLRVGRVVYADIDGDDGVIIAEYRNGLPPLPPRIRWRDLGDSRAGDILNGVTLLAQDTSATPHTAAERAALRAAGIGAYICPVLVKDGQFIGAFGIHQRTARAWTRNEIALAEEVADRMWATLEHRRAEQDLRTNEEQLAFLLRLNDALRPLHDATLVLHTAARLLASHLDVGRVGYAELDGHEYVIRAECTRGVEPLAGRGPASGFGASLRDAYRRGDTVVVNDIESDPRFTDAERVSMRERHIAAFIGVTLIKDGRLVAAFGANQPTPRVWTTAEARLVRDVAERTWDAAERAKAEAALREREQRLRIALTASGGGSWTWDVRTSRADWDDTFRALFGFGPEEPPLFETWLSGVHEDDRARMTHALQEVLASKDGWDHSYRFVRPDGRVRWMQGLGRAERDHTGQVLRLAGLELDVTERRRTEDRIMARRDEEHDRELRLLLETATQGIVSVDAQGIIVTANRALEAMFGWNEGTLIGQPLEQLLPSRMRGHHAVLRTEYFATPGPRLMGRGLTLVGERKDGATFPVEVSLNHVPTESGGRAIAFVTDISERQRTAKALEHRTKQLQQMASELTLAEHHARERIAGMLHDGLQQLLLIVNLNLEELLKRERDSDAPPNESLAEAKQHLDEAIAAARSLHLELFPPVLQRSGLPAALTWLANRTRDTYQLNVQSDIAPDADSERRDVRTLLFESVRELLFNAFKHARAERVTVQASLEHHDRLCISVTDDGVGFDARGLDDQTAPAPVGWGLFSIRERLGLLGGTVDIESAPGRGTRVRLVAPRIATPDRMRSSGSNGWSSVSSAAGTNGNRTSTQALTVMIVDDHAALRRTLRAMLDTREELCVVGEASNGVDAIASAHALRPNVIIMDVVMPRMDGIEATARISAELPGILIFALSMEGSGHAAHAMQHAGAAGYFEKDVDIPRLIDRLLAVHAARAHGGHAVS